MSISTPRKEYQEQLIDVQRNRDAVAGERKVKEKTTEYLPPTSSMCTDTNPKNGQQRISHTVTQEGMPSYLKYLSLAFFYGATGRTVDGLSGLVFSKPPQKEISSSVDYLDDNIDGKGNSLRKQSQRAVEEALITPRSGLLVDFPKVEQHVSVADAERNNLRPKILHYPFESIINWFYEVVDGQLRLSMVVLSEHTETIDQNLKVTTEEKYRVLQLIDGFYHSGLYNEQGEVEIEMTPVRVDGQLSREIPFYLIEVGAEGKSVINDLVDANFNHYRFFADYAAKEHASAFPVFYETGATGDGGNMFIGPGAKWSNPNPEATFGVIQSDSDGGSMRRYLEDMETRMAALGAEMLKPRSAGVESAESKALDKVAQDSTTANVAINVSEAYEKALAFAARWLGSSEESKYRLNTDYTPGKMSAQDLTALVGAWQGGAISFDTFWSNLQRGEIADPEKTADKELSEITNTELGLNNG